LSEIIGDMLNFSKTGLVPDLISAITNLPAETESVSAEFSNRARELAVCLLKSVSQNGATVNLRAHTMPRLNAQQFEIQITGKKL